ncbi:hypothetical protein [Paenarthrobacter nitroguajacolicus]|uniref:hypothetical protein n=1 Tax=Paenarthrobacter nitroguajacolicus TaxID=211146 RepID=UPI0015C07625|nr:hypothetical protein [Paenarthrobacter nitroguajacolicus]NWL34473.1 hypothetical protein [Paenarthrobacter nitroguajacolicus]
MTTIQASERDEIARDILDGRINAAIEEWDAAKPGAFPAHVAAHVADGLCADGYRKPRTVATIEDLDALPFEAVIRDAEGHALERWGDAEHVQWSTPGCKWFVPATEIALPVTVLYEVQP